jgi:hypothetical protein
MILTGAKTRDQMLKPKGKHSLIARSYSIARHRRGRSSAFGDVVVPTTMPARRKKSRRDETGAIAGIEEGKIRGIGIEVLTGDAGVNMMLGTELADEHTDTSASENIESASEIDESDDDGTASSEAMYAARSVRSVRLFWTRVRSAEAMVVRREVRMSDTCGCGWQDLIGEAAAAADQTRWVRASPVARMRTWPGSTKRSNSRPPSAAIHRSQFTPERLAAS